MSKNVVINEKTYNGVSTVQLNIDTGGTATFRDTDEITTPSGNITITENGTHDVTNYASAVVNVEAAGGSASGANTYEMGQFTIEETCRLYTYEHSLGRVPKFVIVYPIDVAVTEQTYAISFETIFNGIGQEDYDISSNSATWLTTPRPLVSYQGTGYQASVIAGGTGTAQEANTVYEGVELTDTYAKVGAWYTQSNNAGFLVAGTYGIILG